MPSMNRRAGRRTMNEINMVPFIDVMLVLLIIFMVTAPLISPSMIQLPSVGGAPKQPDLVARIILDEKQKLEIEYGGKRYGATLGNLASQVEALQAKVRQEEVTDRPADPVAFVIHADKRVTYESVIKVMDTLKKAGANRIALGVQPGS